MRLQRLLVALTILNLGLLTVTLARTQLAGAQDVAPVLRGRALEIVDSQGRIRASIIVQPPVSAATSPNGKAYPESVMLRLIDPKGRPSVKLGGSEQGAGLGLVGASDSTHLVLQAEGASTSLKLADGDGRTHLIHP